MELYIGLSVAVFCVFLMGLCSYSVETASMSNNTFYTVAETNKRITIVASLVVFVFLWALTAFRSAQIGNDTNTYIYYFKLFSDGIDKQRSFELGYQYLNFILGRFSSNPHVFLIVMATIMYGGVMFYIYKYSNNTAISLCLFFCYFFSVFTSIFRQGIAMVIVLYGYQLLKEKKNILAALVFLLATTFHATAFVSFLLFLSSGLFKNKKIVFGVTALALILSGSGALNKVFSIVLPRYAHYFDSRYASTGWLAVAYSLIVYAFWYLMICNSADKNDERDCVVVTNFAMLLFFASFGFSVNLFTRAGEYFLLIGIVEIPNLLYRGKIRNCRFWLFSACFFLIIMFIITLALRPGWNHLYPYEFWK